MSVSAQPLRADAEPTPGPPNIGLPSAQPPPLGRPPPHRSARVVAQLTKEGPPHKQALTGLLLAEAYGLVKATEKRSGTRFTPATACASPSRASPKTRPTTCR